MYLFENRRKDWENSTETCDCLIRNTVWIVRCKKKKFREETRIGNLLIDALSWFNICIRIYFYNIFFFFLFVKNTDVCVSKTHLYLILNQSIGSKLLNLILRRYIDEISSLTFNCIEEKQTRYKSRTYPMLRTTFIILAKNFIIKWYKATIKILISVIFWQ